MYNPPGCVPLVGQNPLTQEPVVRVVPYYPPVMEKTFCSNHPKAAAWENLYEATHRPRNGTAAAMIAP